MKSAVRSDKGTKRHPEQSEGTQPNDRENISLIEMLQTSLHEAVKDLKTRTYAPDVKLTLIQKASALLKNLEALELQSHMKGMNAELMMRIMLRLQPELELDEIKKIYLEEYEKLKSNVEL